MGRYEDATEDAVDLVRIAVEAHFPELQGCNIKVLFDMKKRTSGGKIVLGRIKKANELEKHFTIEQTTNDEGFDYIVFLDKKAWELADEDDKVRLVRHELRHTHVDIDAASPYKLRGHTVEDFYSEIRLNQDNPRWAETLANRVVAAYEGDR